MDETADIRDVEEEARVEEETIAKTEEDKKGEEEALEEAVRILQVIRMLGQAVQTQIHLPLEESVVGTVEIVTGELVNYIVK